MLPNDQDGKADESSTCDSIVANVCHRKKKQKERNHISSIIHHFDLAVHMSITRIHIQSETTAEDTLSSRAGIYRDK